MQTAVALPRIYLGTMTFAWNQVSSKVDAAVGAKFLQRFAAGKHEVKARGGLLVDTARIYAGGNTEPCVREAISLAGLSTDSHSIGSKAHPSQPNGLSAEGLRSQHAKCCDALGVSRLGEFYLHQPDTENSLLDSLRAADAMVQEQLIGRIGLSNYHASEVERCFALCAEHKLTPPSVYQGLYNPLNRRIEEDLLPVLRRNGCSFVAYNPLAAGLLSGKYAAHDPASLANGRFKDNPNYIPRFFTPNNFAALAGIRTACDEARLPLIDATYRWLLCHSALSADDGVLIGASSMEQLEQNLSACEAARSSGPLPATVVAAIDAAWVTPGLSDEAFKYWRDFSADMPDRENLDPGASYSAAKTKQ